MLSASSWAGTSLATMPWCHCRIVKLACEEHQTADQVAVATRSMNLMFCVSRGENPPKIAPATETLAGTAYSATQTNGRGSMVKLSASALHGSTLPASAEMEVGDYQTAQETGQLAELEMRMA